MNQALGIALLTGLGIFLVLFVGSTWVLDMVVRGRRVDVGQRLEKRSNGNGNGDARSTGDNGLARGHRGA